MSQLTPTFFLTLTILVALQGTNGANNNNKNSGGHPVYEFATKLLNQVAVEKGGQKGVENILISPFSIRTALTMLSLGARGKTLEEIQRVLQLPSGAGQDQIVQVLAKQIGTTVKSETSTFKVGNGLFLDKSFSLNETLSKTLKSKLGATVKTTDFDNDPFSSFSTVNEWISSVTQGQINNLVTGPITSSSSPSLSFVLANALFYSGRWESPFTLLPKKKPFRLDSKEEVLVTMMAVESTLGYSYIKELKSICVSLPFKDDRFSFIIIKPDEGQSVSGVRPLLTNYPLDKLNDKLGENLRTLTLTLPKFTLKSNLDTINVMRKMGISSMFDPVKADLSGLVTKGAKANRPTVSRMIHQTLLNVNELGATASAATAVAGYPISVSSSLEVDKPFLFLLNDRLTGPVLIGQFVNPQQ